MVKKLLLATAFSITLAVPVSQASAIDPEVTAHVDTMEVDDVVVAAGDSTVEAPLVEVGIEANEQESVATPPPENVAPEALTSPVQAHIPEGGAGSEPVPEELDEVEPSWFDRLTDFLWTSDNSLKAKAVLMKQKMDARRDYGEDADSPINFPVIMESIAALKEADERREQAQLAMEIAEAERQKLYNDSLECLALNGYHESRGETADQEVAAAAVVLNRLSVGFRGATTICEVIYTPKQFSWVEQHGVHIPDTENPIERRAWQRSLLIAKRMLDPDATFIDPSNGAQYYYNPSLVDWRYKHAYKQVAVLGSHRFMAEKDPSHPHYIDNNQVRINPVLFNGLTHEERDQLKLEFQNSERD